MWSARVWRVNPAGMTEAALLVRRYKRWSARGRPCRCARKLLGGLPTPRVPSEIRGGRVFAKDGTDVTGAFTCGAEEALRLALENGCTAAILKARSPSCGSGEIYDGSFTGTRVPGEGVFAVWHVRRDSKSGARRRSPKEDSPSCRKSTDGIKTKSGSTRGVAGCETVFSRGMHKKPLQRTAFVPRPAWKAICAGKACEHRFDNVESLWKGRDASRADSFGERDFAEESPLSRCL